MTSLVDELSAQARALPPEDRARLADDLLESLQEDSESEAQAAWDREIERRVREIRAGTAGLVPAADVHAEARLIYGR